MAAEPIPEPVTEILGKLHLVDVPDAGPDTPVEVANLGPSWGDVWHWVQGRSKSAVDEASSILGVNLPAVLGIVENYVGNSIKALSGPINDIFSGLEGAIDDIANLLGLTIEATGAELARLDALTGNMLGRLYTLEAQTIPALFADLAHVPGWIQDAANFVTQEVEQWAIDNIYDPLNGLIIQVDTDLNTYIDGVARVLDGKWTRELAIAVAGLNADLGPLKAAVANLETEAQECTEPMCAVVGPKTDLGKLFKLLSVAEGLAFFTYLASLDGAGVERLIGSVESDVSGVVGDIASIFTGGETVGSAIGDIVLG